MPRKKKGKVASKKESAPKKKKKSVSSKKEPNKKKEILPVITIEDKIKEKEIKDKEYKKKKEPVKTIFIRERIITENSQDALELYNQSRYGMIVEDKLQLSLVEASYLLERGKIEVFDGRKKKLTIEEFIRKAQKLDPNFWVRYCVFKDIRNRGYIIKTALKFGADFRVYPRGVKPGDDHAKWIVYPVYEGSTSTWYEFAAKNRVAHSTKKKLLIGIVDEENSVTYYEIRWVRP